MVEKRCLRTVLTALWLLPLASLAVAESVIVSSAVDEVTADKFHELMQGEWMLEFYAPWCPACKQFSSTWEDFADWVGEDPSRNLHVGKVDVSKETMLSGQFMVTHLPSLFHIYNGQVRVYQGSRSLSDLIDYYDGQRWTKDDPTPWWRSPTASHMRAIGIVFWLSEKAKELQVVLEEKYEFPSYAVFIVIAVATIIVGLTLGGLTVCFIEVCMRLCSRKQPGPIVRNRRKQPSSGSPDEDDTLPATGPSPKPAEPDGQEEDMETNANIGSPDEDDTPTGPSPKLAEPDGQEKDMETNTNIGSPDEDDTPTGPSPKLAEPDGQEKDMETNTNIDNPYSPSTAPTQQMPRQRKKNANKEVDAAVD